MKKLFIFSLGLVLFLTFAGNAHSISYVFYDEAAFSGYAGSATIEGFDTIPIDNWIYHTRLPSPIPALDLTDDPADPNDGPDYDLDGNFSITGNSIAYAPPDELFIIYDYPSDPDNNFLSFSPWSNSSWPTYDPANEFPIITIDNFNNDSSSINAFGLYYRLGLGPTWIAFDFGDAGYVQLDPDQWETNQWSFFGFISDIPFAGVELYTNQNGSSIYIDGVTYSSDAAYLDPVPEPSSLILLSFGLLGVVLLRKRFSI